MNPFTFIETLAGAFQSLFSWLNAKRLKDAGRDELSGEINKEIIKDVQDKKNRDERLRDDPLLAERLRNINHPRK